MPTTLPNIIKAFIKEPEDFHKVKEEITKALNDLIDARIILYGNNTYRITSDLEQRMLDEQRNFTVQSYMKKKRLVAAYKNSQMVKTLARLNDLSLQYDFYITTDSDDELTTPGLKYLKIKVKSIYNLSDDRTTDIETLKMQHQNDKDTIWLIPDNDDFNEINILTDETGIGRAIEHLGFLVRTAHARRIGDVDQHHRSRCDKGLSARGRSDIPVGKSPQAMVGRFV